MKPTTILPLAAIALASCATVPAKVSVPPGEPTAGLVRTISYETSPCFGFCPEFTFSVSSDGRGIFVGKRATAVTGTRQFAVTPQEFEAFEARLAPYRPAGERRLATGAECHGRVATDMSSVEVVWSGKGPLSSLYAYFGCNMEENRAMFDALRGAPETIPELQTLIGKR